MLGFVTSSTPTLVRFRSPPDMPFNKGPPTSVVAHLTRPSSESILSVKASNSSSVVSLDRRNLAENRIHSRGVDEIIRESSCATKAICLRFSMLVGSTTRLSRRRSASTVRAPALEVLPDKMLSNEVLPAPDGPKIKQKGVSLVNFQINQSQLISTNNTFDKAMFSSPILDKNIPRIAVVCLAGT